MTTNPLNFLEAEPSGVEETQGQAEAQTAPEPAAQPQAEAPEPAAATSRGPDGKFTAKAEPQAADTAQTPLSEKETVGFYRAMQDERDKRQALERQLAEIKASHAAQTPAEPPSLQAQVEARLYTANLDNSRKWAVKEHGAEVVEKAFEWANARCEPTSPQFDPAFNAKVAASRDPYEEAVKAYKGETNLAEYRAWQAAQAGGQTQPAPAYHAPPPRSLANASGTGGLGKDATPVHEGAAYEALPFNQG